jgi:hypothetical protein
MRPWIWVVLLMLTLVLPSAATAGMYEDGVRLFDALEYQSARPFFEQALASEALSNSQKAQVHRRLAEINAADDSPDRAVEHYVQLLLLQPSFALPPVASPKLVELLIEAKTKLVGTLIVKSNATIARIEVDGKAINPVQPKVVLPIGMHEVTIKSGRKEVSESFEVKFRETTNAYVALPSNWIDISMSVGAQAPSPSSGEWKYDIDGNDDPTGDISATPQVGPMVAFQFMFLPTTADRFKAGFAINYHHAEQEVTFKDYKTNLEEAGVATDRDASDRATFDFKYDPVGIFGVLGYDFDFFNAPYVPYLELWMGGVTGPMELGDWSGNHSEISVAFHSGAKYMFDSGYFAGFDFGAQGVYAPADIERKIPDTDTRALWEHDMFYMCVSFTLLGGYRF